MTALISGLGQVFKGTRAKTGKEYAFREFHIQYKDSRVEGTVCMKQSISLLQFPQAEELTVGQKISLEYDNTGKLINIEKIG